MTRPAPSAARRWGASLGVALALALAAAGALLAGALREVGRSAAERRATVSVRALADVVRVAGGAGPAVREAAAKWQAANPAVTAIKVVAFDGISLEASTAPEDAGEKAAPRRLALDEKPLYDQGQRLRAAIETNVQEGAARKEEIEGERTGAGRWRIAAPVETGGAVTGMLSLETKSPPARGRAPVGAIAAFLAGTLLIFAGVAAASRRRAAVLAVAAFALDLAAIGLFGRVSLGSLRRERRAAESAVGREVAADAARARELLGSEAAARLDPASWDSDAFRRPRGTLLASGAPDEARLSREIEGMEKPVRRTIALLAAFSVAVLAFGGFGLAGALRRTLVAHRAAYLYTVPAMVGMIVLVFFPFVYGIAISFTDQNIYNTNKPLTEIWIGLRNYADILGDFSIAKHTASGALVFNYLNFYWTFLFTVVWTVCNVTFGVTMGLLLALALNTKGLALRPVYRVLLILPWAVPNYITALIWKGMFHQQFGVINQVIQIFGGRPVSWFERPFTSFITVLSTNGWLSFPFMMVISLGALQSIPAEIYEAARVDGASRWQQFKAITLPSLKPALIPAIILSVVWTFNMFNIIYLVSQGEPASSTEILITQAYKFAFEKYRYGYAAAYSTVIFAILLVYGSIQNRMTRATEAI